MDAKSLNEYFKKVDQMEKKAIQLKEYLDSLKTRFKERQQKLDSIKRQKKTIEDKCESISLQIPKTLTEVIVVESENKILLKQIEVFEQKISDLRQQMSDFDEKRIQSINKFSSDSLEFCKNYGINGRFRTQSELIEEEIRTLENKRNQLQNKSQSLDKNAFKAIISEYESLNQRVISLTLEKTRLQSESSEWMAIELNLRQCLNKVKDNENKELIELRQQLQEIERKAAQPHIQSEPQLFQICDSNDEKSDPPQPPPTPTQPVVKAIPQTKKRPQIASNTIQSKKFEAKRVFQREDTDDIKLWELRRQRLLPKSDN